MIDPRGMRDMREWSDFVTLPLQLIGVNPRRLENSDNWQDWAYNLLQSSALQGFQVADPRFFGIKDWMEWAFRFNQVVPY